jgi:hypothetical protein
MIIATDPRSDLTRLSIRGWEPAIKRNPPLAVEAERHHRVAPSVIVALMDPAPGQLIKRAPQDHGGHIGGQRRLDLGPSARQEGPHAPSPHQRPGRDLLSQRAGPIPGRVRRDRSVPILQRRSLAGRPWPADRPLPPGGSATSDQSSPWTDPERDSSSACSGPDDWHAPAALTSRARSGCPDCLPAWLLGGLGCPTQPPAPAQHAGDDGRPAQPCSQHQNTAARPA